MKNNNDTSREELTDLLIKLNEYIEDEDMPVVKRLIDQHTKTMCERARVKAQLGMIEYYDQVTNNKDMDWKGLFADNRKALEYDLSKLQSPNKREDSDE